MCPSRATETGVQLLTCPARSHNVSLSPVELSVASPDETRATWSTPILSASSVAKVYSSWTNNTVACNTIFHIGCTGHADFEWKFHAFSRPDFFFNSAKTKLRL